MKQKKNGNKLQKKYWKLKPKEYKNLRGLTSQCDYLLH